MVTPLAGVWIEAEKKGTARKQFPIRSFCNNRKNKPDSQFKSITVLQSKNPNILFDQPHPIEIRNHLLLNRQPDQKERERLEAGNQGIGGMFMSLYTDKAKGIPTEQRFMKLTLVLEQEREANQKRLKDLALM